MMGGVVLICVIHEVLFTSWTPLLLIDGAVH